MHSRTTNRRLMAAKYSACKSSHFQQLPFRRLFKKVETQPIGHMVFTRARHRFRIQSNVNEIRNRCAALELINSRQRFRSSWNHSRLRSRLALNRHLQNCCQLTEELSSFLHHHLNYGSRQICIRHCRRIRTRLRRNN